MNDPRARLETGTCPSVNAGSSNDNEFFAARAMLNVKFRNHQRSVTSSTDRPGLSRAFLLSVGARSHAWFELAYRARPGGATKSTGPKGLRDPTNGPLVIGSGRVPTPKPAPLGA